MEVRPAPDRPAISVGSRQRSAVVPDKKNADQMRWLTQGQRRRCERRDLVGTRYVRSGRVQIGSCHAVAPSGIVAQQWPHLVGVENLSMTDRRRRTSGLQVPARASRPSIPPIAERLATNGGLDLCVAQIRFCFPDSLAPSRPACAPLRRRCTRQQFPLCSWQPRESEPETRLMTAAICSPRGRYCADSGRSRALVTRHCSSVNSERPRFTSDNGNGPDG